MLKGCGFMELAVAFPSVKEKTHMQESSTRCAGCGKPLADGEDAKRISDGKIREGEFEERKEWGVMHRSCHNRRADGPDATLDELRRQARR
jgi:hypothetical protein